MADIDLIRAFIRDHPMRDPHDTDQRDALAALLRIETALHTSAAGFDEAANIIRPNLPRTATIFEQHAKIVRAVV